MNSFRNVLGWSGWLFGLVIATWFFPAVLMGILPGALLIFHPALKQQRFLTIMVLVVVTSLASYIGLFSLLKFIPLPFTLAAQTVMLSSGLAGMWLSRRCSFTFTFRRNDVWEIGVMLPLFLMYGSWSLFQLVPAGADMATHSYVAKTIAHYNAFPTTYYPIVPIEKFGFESFGMPALMALVALFTTIPMHTTALVSSLFLFPLAGLVFFVWLRSYFSIGVSAITIYFLFFVNFNFSVLLSFGALPTVLGIIFLAATAYVAKLLFIEKQFTLLTAGWLGTLIAASALSHLIPIAAGIYFVIPLMLWVTWTHVRNWQFWSFGVITALTAVVLCAGFLLSLQPLSDATYEYLKDWQWNQSQLSVMPVHPVLKPLVFVKQETSPVWATLILIGILAACIWKRPEAKWFLSCLVIYWVLIMNAEHWYLPLSPALYPSRITATGDIFFLYFVALSLALVEKLFISFLSTSLPQVVKTFGVMATLAVATFLTKHSLQLVVQNYLSLAAVFRSESLVTEDDLVVMRWMSEHLADHDVVSNNYGDASIWIPALAGKMILQNDASPQSFDTLGRGIKNLKPTYAFIGSKALYTDHVYVTASSAAERGHLVMESGKTQLYTID